MLSYLNIELGGQKKRAFLAFFDYTELRLGQLKIREFQR